MEQRPGTEGDYGYDLAHEVPGRSVPGAPPGVDPAVAAAAAADAVGSEDLGYDEAHEFRGGDTDR